MQPNFGLRAGMRLGDRYRLEDRLGAGGMGEVWRAFDEGLNRTVAVKTMLPSAAQDPDFVRRFAAEATAMARVNHPAVAAIHDVVQADGHTFLVMEFIDGESLAQRLARDGRIAPDETMRIITLAAEGLQAVHDQNMLHRDIKPANIMLRHDGGVLITDFGIVRHEDESRLTASGAVLGTPSYLSPEQVLGQPVDRRSDVYSLGLVAYECLAGERPFVGDNPYAVALQRIQQEPKTLGTDLPATVLALVERALAVDPEKRFPSALALAEAARRVELTPAGAARTVSGKSPRRALVAAVAGVVIVAVVIAGIVLRRSGHDPGRATAAGKPAASATGNAPAGFGPCDGGYCPSAPMCWGGMVATAGKASPPVSRYCPGTHRWETFLAIRLPGEAPVIDSDAPLIEKPDVAKACSAEALAQHSIDPEATRSWRRDAWPVQDGAAWLLHCIAQPKSGSSTGAAFKP